MSLVLEAREPSARYLEPAQPALVRQFAQLATAPGGVARLRELILTLAVEGKLVVQCSSDEPASELLARARTAAFEQRRQRRKSALSDLDPFEPDAELPALPSGWVWCRGADLYTVIRGVTYQKADASDAPAKNHLPILRANNIRASINFDDLVYVPQTLISDEQLLRCGDFVVCLASGSKALVGKAAMFNGGQACSFGAFCGVIRLAVPLPFFSAFLASPLYRDAVSAASSGIGINNLKGSTLLTLAIALPPEAEQARIVARVDELMRLCDALEAKGRLEAEQHARLLGALLGTLTDSSTPEELAANWQRVADHFDLLIDRPEAVDALEQTILQLAVRGLLVQQDPSDEPAAVVVSRINAGRVSRRTAAATATLADVDHPDLPAGWCETNVGSVAECLDYVRRPVKKADREASGGTVPYYGANGQVGWISDHLFDEDLVLVVEDETFIGRIKPFSYVVRGKSWVNNHAHVLRPLGGVSADFLNLCLQRYDFIPLTSGTTNRRKLTQPSLLNAKFMIPPLHEQARILARVTELRRLCADLRQRLTASQTTQTHLAEALVDSVA